MFVSDGIIFYNNRVIIPSSLRKKMLNFLHEAHFGISKTKARAKMVFYWPNMNQCIENMIQKCLICEKFRSNNVKEELTQYEVPDLPFHSVSCDILYFAGYDYLVLYDRFSKWLECCRLKFKDSYNIIQCLKKIFSVHGIPEVVVADNVPFNSFAIKKFAHEWCFEIITTSPFYSQSNGLAEKAVDIAKNMLKKSKESGNDIDLMLLEYRNTPIVNIGFSPSQILMSRVSRTKIFTMRNLLFPKIINGVKEKLIEINQKVKAHYDKTCKVKKVSFKEGDDVVYRYGKEWKSGRIVRKYHTPKSWQIRNSNNNIIRRNSRHLKKSFNQASFGNNYEDINVTNRRHENLNMNNRNQLTVRGIENSENDLIDRPRIDNGIDLSNDNMNVNNGINTRSGRIIRPPTHLRNDYLLY